MRRKVIPTSLPHVRVAVIGAGFGGLGTAIRLKQAGIDDFVVLERAHEVGGTWQVNSYPGAQCDVPSLIYSFSFAPNPDWSRLYPLQEEIQAYLHRCAVDFGVLPHVRFGTEVTDASWDDAAQLWRISTSTGDLTATVLVGAIGPFSAPSVPDLPGLDRFEGTVFHSQGWNHDHDLIGERVGVIGTGASAVQFIPRVQPQADHLTVFQRTPTWILPHPDRPVGTATRLLYRRVPGAQAAARKAWELTFEALVPGFINEPRLQKPLEVMGRALLRKQVRDPELRARLTPSYAVGCKRPTFSNTYYPALTAENTTVVSDGIVEVTERGIVTADGAEHELDTIIFGTGFKMTDHPVFDRIHGRGGVSVGEEWRAGEMAAYLGTTLHHFPNLFLILGPNSGVYTSAVITIEAQVHYVVEALRAMEEGELASLEVTARAQQDFLEWADAGLSRSVFVTGGCHSYYLSPTGRNFTHFPGFSATFRSRTRKVDLDHYAVRRHDPAGTGAREMSA
ncbi:MULTISPECIES: flavin-containing monooxygenase [unclassified Nocardioides]|uniref:flavin-containing monooxygenase n=1 Tax=unclassified Nocardioides TaxID=2615069 RepID=UPI0006F79DA5|nr:MULTISPECIES: NAD(P)/FAD-dependent oxidoreductase [unclassified Nocardioides]KRA37654.1 cyclohexanone monooxygenase [Nocardioides sp. Root614]KRA91614.1 cyclohexanone monooxygenase [Nocardioides sp. Root682]